MKTLITTLAIAVMAISFSGEAFANAETNDKTKKAFTEPVKWIECNLGGEGKPVAECNEDIKDAFSENESGETDNDREVVDSGEEGSTSAASASDQ